MTGRDVPPSDTGADESSRMWEAVLDGRRLPETEDEMRAATIVTALQAPGTADELQGAEGTVTALLAHLRAAQIEKSLLSEKALLSEKTLLAEKAARSEKGSVVVPFAPVRRRRAAVVAGSLVAVTAVLAGTAAAAATGSLPAPLQRLAESYVGAPAPAVEEDDDSAPTAEPSDGTSRTPTTTPSPRASGPAALPLQGLCRAFASRPAGQPATGSVAYQRLAAAAAARGLTVEALCADALGTTSARPGASAGQGGKPSTPPGQAGKPTTPPGQSHRPTANPGNGGKPSTPPGQAAKPSTPPGQGHKPTTPPGQGSKPSAAPTRP